MAIITITARSGEGGIRTIKTAEHYELVKDRMFFRARNMEVTNAETGSRVIINKTYVVTIEEGEREREDNRIDQ